MEKLKKALDRIFIEGLSAMAQGLFATLIIGTIIQQVGTLLGGSVGEMIYVIGKAAASLTGAGIGVAVPTSSKNRRWSWYRRQLPEWPAHLPAIFCPARSW